MKEVINFGSRIAIFAAVSALILAGVFSIANPLIEKSKQKEIQTALTEILPNAVSFKKIENNEKNLSFYQGLDAHKKVVGYILPAFGKGYSSTIEMLVAIDHKKKILGLKIINQQETPGLGTRIMEVKEGASSPWFQAQFVNKIPTALKLKKDGGSIDAITGATISSKAVVTGLAQEINSFKIPTKK
ncbi:MAG: RnfABCDGE type electron transport complex subunit G [Candidatus Margulisbacteria bacterium]|nr:RnfABCDGE type electron transport complex subunit G [Candidatus Margulisiibacteriota bacterium]